MYQPLSDKWQDPLNAGDQTSWQSLLKVHCCGLNINLSVPQLGPQSYLLVILRRQSCNPIVELEMWIYGSDSKGLGY